LDKIGPETSADTQDEKSMRKELTDYEAGITNTWDTNPEHLDQLADDGQVLKVTSLGDRPFIVLEAENSLMGVVPHSLEMQRLSTDVYHEVQNTMCHLSSKCQVEVVPGVNLPAIISDKAVFNAIKEMYDTVKKK